MCTERSENHTHAPGTARAEARTMLRFDLFGAGISSRPPVSDAQRPPALRVHRHKFERAVDEEWAPLFNPEDVRGRIAPNLRAVGRIHQDRVTLGTGFLVSKNVVLTNRHVAESFTTNVEGIRKIRAGWEPAIDFIAHLPPPKDAGTDEHQEHPAGDHDHPTVEKASAVSFKGANGMLESIVSTTEHGDGGADEHAPHHSGDTACFRITSVIYVDDEIDLALLRVDFDRVLLRVDYDANGRVITPATPPAPPKPVKLAVTPPRVGRVPVYVIGCPDHDDTAMPNELSTVFQDTFDVKRLQPGHLIAILMSHADRVEIDHDCSTLRGNSGSCVVDLETHQVIGLHVRGSREGPGEAAYNQAIGLWQLPATTRLMMEAAGVMFEQAAVEMPLASARAMTACAAGS
jgi:hypothetical protein